MKIVIMCIVILCFITQVFARAIKSSSQGCVLVSGTIIQNNNEPVFKFMKSHKYNKDNYVLSHTRFFIHGFDGNNYEIMMNNLFYTWVTSSQVIANRDIGITANMRHNYPVGSDVVACGKLVHSNGQKKLHFVHPSGCYKTKFNGYLKINGSVITDNKRYCDSCSC